MSGTVSQADGRQVRVAAIYARVSSERQRQEQTIQSQTVALRELAEQRALLVAEELVFEDDGFSGASLQRPALERLRDRAFEGCFESCCVMRRTGSRADTPTPFQVTTTTPSATRTAAVACSPRGVLVSRRLQVSRLTTTTAMTRPGTRTTTMGGPRVASHPHATDTVATTT